MRDDPVYVYVSTLPMRTTGISGRTSESKLTAFPVHGTADDQDTWVLQSTNSVTMALLHMFGEQMQATAQREALAALETMSAETVQ